MFKMFYEFSFWILLGILIAGTTGNFATFDTEPKDSHVIFGTHSTNLDLTRNNSLERNSQRSNFQSDSSKTIIRRSANHPHGPPFAFGHGLPFGNRFPKPWGQHGNGHINFGNGRPPFSQGWRPPFGQGWHANNHGSFNLHQTEKHTTTENAPPFITAPVEKLPKENVVPVLEIPESLEMLHDSYAKWWSQFHKDLKSCGQSSHLNSPPIFRVIGGMFGKIEEWPWMVSMYSELIQQPWCAGTLIADQWVITAAHCFNGPFANAMSWSLHFGKVNSSGAAEYQREQVRTIDALFIHPDYSQFARSYAFNGDIALIKLNKPVEFTDTTAPICLVRATNDLEDKELKCKITGYGISNLTDVHQGLNVLHVAEVPLVDMATCSVLDGYKDKVTNNMICAGRMDGGVDTCKGDSGGPLQCQFDEKWHLTGVTSWGGKTYQECAEPNQPGVYTDVSKYSTWIYTHMFLDYAKMHL